MATQTSSLGNLEYAQNVIINQAKFTAESEAPCKGLVNHFKLSKGQSTLRLPKVGQATMDNLVEGIDIVQEQDIGLSYQDLVTGEVGGKFILTRKLMEQFNEDVFKLVGKQMGDAMARKTDEDIIALFSALNGGTTLGADNVNFSLRNATAVVNFAFAHLYPSPIKIVMHPNALGWLTRSAAGIGASYYQGIISEEQADTLRKFWKVNLNGVNMYWDANIDKIAGTDSGYGAIFGSNCMAYLSGWEPEVEREKDISLRAWEVVMTTDYGVYEIDDAYGAPLRYEIGDMSTSSTST